jgi:PAS domain S-box-containing protein
MISTRAMESIVSAPASARERIVAVGLGVLLVGALVASAPYSSIPLPNLPAVVATIRSAQALACVLTAILLFVQWRISAQAELAILATAYSLDALMDVLFIVMFPGVFRSGALLGVGPQAASWLWFGSHVLFDALIIACVLVGRRRTPLSPRGVRLFVSLAVLFAAGVITLLITQSAHLPVLMVGRVQTQLWRSVLVPTMLAEIAIACVLLAATRLATVANTWLFLVMLIGGLQIIGFALFSHLRYSLGWYLSFAEGLLGSTLLLFVFLVKINELLVRLAADNRALTERGRSDALAIAESIARYRSFTNVVPQLIATADTDGHIDYVNDRWIAYTGLNLEYSLDTDVVMQTIHPDERADFRSGWDAALLSQTHFSAECRLRAASNGRYHWFLIDAIPLRDRRDKSAEVTGWIVTCTDIDSVKRNEERNAFLRISAERLSATIDMAATLATVGSLVVPRLGRWTHVALIDDDSRFHGGVVMHPDPVAEAALRPLVEHPLEGATQEALAAIVERGDVVVINTPTEFALVFPGERDRAVFLGGGAHSAMVVPLRSGDVAIGVLTLVAAETAAFGPDDVALASEFAARAALALEHARLFEREHAMADALQRAMLPTKLPQFPGVAFSASYSAASESQRVGGDFYDAFTLDDGRIALTIGDVTGHGIEATVVMGEIRQALRAAALEHTEPSSILNRASKLLTLSGRALFVTAIFAILDPRSGRLVYATAGHPPVILCAGEQMFRLSGSGMPIGLRDDDGVDFALSLHAPCTLVFYTDGLLEFTRDLDEGERRLEGAIRDLTRNRPPTEHLAGDIMHHVLGEDAAHDDIAILAVTISSFADEDDGEDREWRFDSRDRWAATLVRHEIGELVAAGASEEQRFIGELAFGELLANVVCYAPGVMRVRYRAALGDNSAIIRVDDSGTGFDLGVRRGDVLEENGRGFALLRELATDVSVRRNAAGGASVAVQMRLPQAERRPFATSGTRINGGG